MPVGHARRPTFQQGLPVDVQHCMFRWNLSDLSFEASAEQSRPWESSSLTWQFVNTTRGRQIYTVMDPSFEQDPSVEHFKFLTQISLNRYQINYMMSCTTP